MYISWRISVCFACEAQAASAVVLRVVDNVAVELDCRLALLTYFAMRRCAQSRFAFRTYGVMRRCLSFASSDALTLRSNEGLNTLPHSRVRAIKELRDFSDGLAFLMPAVYQHDLGFGDKAPFATRHRGT